MKKRVKFPARNSVVTRPLVAKMPTAPAKGETPEAFEERKKYLELLSCVEVDLLLLGRADVVALRHGYTMFSVGESKRAADLEAAGQPVPGYTEAGLKELRDLQRDTVKRIVRGVRGLDVGDQQSDALEGEKLLDLIDDTGLLADFASIARDAQDPTPQQLER